MFFLLLLGIALSQFYIFPSGIPQPSHYLMATAIIAHVLGRGFRVPTEKKELAVVFLFVFVFYQFLVNSVYSLLYLDFSFFVQAIYIVYGFFVFYVLVFYFNLKKSALRGVSYCLLMSLFFLFLAAIFGYGDYKFFPRYNGFFNDPNQMAFWVLCVVSIVILSGIGKVWSSLAFFVGVFLVFKTASRSGMVGLAVLFLGFLGDQFFSRSKKEGVNKPFYLMAAVLLACLLTYFFYDKGADVFGFILDRADSTDVEEQAKIRGYTRIIEFPEYVIFGAGHGVEIRFDVLDIEIHSTWAGLIFYYGFLGFIVFSSAIYQVARPLAWSERLLLLSPLFYSISTYSLRTPIFWVFIAIFFSFSLDRNRVHK